MELLIFTLKLTISIKPNLKLKKYQFKYVVLTKFEIKTIPILIYFWFKSPFHLIKNLNYFIKSLEFKYEKANHYTMNKNDERERAFARPRLRLFYLTSDFPVLLRVRRGDAPKEPEKNKNHKRRVFSCTVLRGEKGARRLLGSFTWRGRRAPPGGRPRKGRPDCRRWRSCQWDLGRPTSTPPNQPQPPSAVRSSGVWFCDPPPRRSRSRRWAPTPPRCVHGIAGARGARRKRSPQGASRRGGRTSTTRSGASWTWRRPWRWASGACSGASRASAGTYVSSGGAPPPTPPPGTKQAPKHTAESCNEK